MPSSAGGACMWRTRKCAEGRSWLRMWRVASRVGCSERLEMVAVRDLDLAWPGGLVRVLVERRDLERVSKVVILVEGLG